MDIPTNNKRKLNSKTVKYQIAKSVQMIVKVRKEFVSEISKCDINLQSTTRTSLASINLLINTR